MICLAQRCWVGSDPTTELFTENVNEQCWLTFSLYQRCWERDGQATEFSLNILRNSVQIYTMLLSRGWPNDRNFSLNISLNNTTFELSWGLEPRRNLKSGANQNNGLKLHTYKYIFCIIVWNEWKLFMYTSAEFLNVYIENCAKLIEALMQITGTFQIEFGCYMLTAEKVHRLFSTISTILDYINRYCATVWMKPYRDFILIILLIGIIWIPTV